MDNKLEKLLEEINSEILSDFNSYKKEDFEKLSNKIKDAIHSGLSEDKLFIDMFRGQFEAIKIRNDN
jgi:hypothetical protein